MALATSPTDAVNRVWDLIAGLPQLWASEVPESERDRLPNAQIFTGDEPDTIGSSGVIGRICPVTIMVWDDGKQKVERLRTKAVTGLTPGSVVAVMAQVSVQPRLISRGTRIFLDPVRSSDAKSVYAAELNYNLVY